ncbi:3-dehydroquinate dehydratase [Cohnella caldifontis]|uniref:3-dehydroquinate dehydratase n=1 Tax=Cohnella caldifontis TaxID=3027471 RepID=UPI0023EBE0B6|nr:3-dehydroquinate dehydratase [Cohnella sp. YIM B05605]
MKADVKKVMIEFHDNRIPVYYNNERRGTIELLVQVLEKKWRSGRRLVQQFLSDLDSVEIEGTEAILYSARGNGTLALSLY